MPSDCPAPEAGFKDPTAQPLVHEFLVRLLAVGLGSFAFSEL